MVGIHREFIGRHSLVGHYKFIESEVSRSLRSIGDRAKPCAMYLLYPIGGHRKVSLEGESFDWVTRTADRGIDGYPGNGKARCKRTLRALLPPSPKLPPSPPPPPPPLRVTRTALAQRSMENHYRGGPFLSFSVGGRDTEWERKGEGGKRGRGEKERERTISLIFHRVQGHWDNRPMKPTRALPHLRAFGRSPSKRVGSKVRHLSG